MFLNRIIVLATMMALCVCVCSCAKEPVKRVLVIHSYEAKYVGYQDFNKFIKKQFDKEELNVDIRTLYLDCEVYNESEELSHMHYMIDSLCRSWSPDVILVNEDQATYSLLACGHMITQRVPIVFSGVNYPNTKLISKYPNVTGFRDHIDIMANLRVAKELFGQATEMYTILDYTYLDRMTRKDAKQQIAPFNRVEFVDSVSLGVIGNWSMGSTDNISRLRAFPARSQYGNASLIWTLRRYHPNQCYIQLKRDFTTASIGNICFNPCLTAINEAFGHGEKLLGGYFTSIPIQVEQSVGAAASILRGTDPSQIPITTSRKEYVLDWVVMSQLDIPLNKVSNKYRIINIPMRDKYPLVWVTTILLVWLTIAAIIGWLFILYRREQGRRRRALQALAEEKQNLELAIAGGATYSWSIENGCVVFEKDFWEAIGVEPISAPFEKMLDMVHPDQRDEITKNWNPAKAWKRIAQLRCNFNGEGFVWWEFRYTTKVLANGEYKTAGLVLNIQSIKDREMELEEARKLAEKAELKQSFLANMSHEIRTPLNAIVGFSSILASGEEIDESDRKIFIDSINRNNNMLLKLVNDILELSRLESGAMSFEFKDCLVSDIVNEVYDTHRMLVSSQLEYIKQEDAVPMIIHVDSGRLTQVLTNFLHNACKFTTEGYIKLGYCHIAAEDKVRIYIEDTGKGIDAQEQKMIFGRFYKQDQFTQGTGLGLSISQVIAEKLCGQIELYSEKDKGSCFSIILPCRVE